MTARIDKTVVSGVFSLDGQDFDVDNNVWLVGDDDEVLARRVGVAANRTVFPGFAANPLGIVRAR